MTSMPSAGPSIPYSVTFELNMNIDDITPELLCAIRTKLAGYLGIRVADMVIAVKAGSVLVEVTIMTQGKYPKTDQELREDLLRAFDDGSLVELLVGLRIENVLETEARPGLYWSEWLSLDVPKGVDSIGDEELVFEHLDRGVCNGLMPLGVYCRTLSNVSWEFTQQNFAQPCTLAGIVCRNSDNQPAGCDDYALKLLCPPSSAYVPPPRLKWEQYHIAVSQAPRLPVSPAISKVLALPAPLVNPSNDVTSCTLGCSGHGKCDHVQLGACECDDGWF